MCVRGELAGKDASQIGKTTQLLGAQERLSSFQGHIFTTKSSNTQPSLLLAYYMQQMAPRWACGLLCLLAIAHTSLSASSQTPDVILGNQGGAQRHGR